MSQSLTINNREYIPAGEVGRHFGYTRDYILTLAREKKIDGQKIGHRWYVNLDSAKTFFAESKAEREVRRHTVSETRKAELRRYSESRVEPRKSTALTETFAIVFIGLLIGVTGYMGTNLQYQAALGSSDFSFFKQLAVSLYDLFSFEQTLQATEEREVAPEEEGAIEVGSVAYAEPVATTTHTSLVVGTDQVLTTTTIQTIRESFSDDVSVSIDPHNPDTGIIIPHFKESDGEAYRFLMVPVTQAPTQ